MNTEYGQLLRHHLAIPWHWISRTELALSGRRALGLSWFRAALTQSLAVIAHGLSLTCAAHEACEHARVEVWEKLAAALVHGSAPCADPSCDTVSFSRTFGMIWDPDTRSALNSNTPNSATACAVGVSMKLDYVGEAT